MYVCLCECACVCVRYHVVCVCVLTKVLVEKGSDILENPQLKWFEKRVF
jgi:hypothetical protein